MKTYPILAGFVITLIGFSLLSAAEPTGRDIMVKVDEQHKVQTEIAKTRMILINKAGKTLEREVLRYQKTYNGKDGIDDKMLVFFEYPNDIRGTGLLLWTYVATDKDDDRWLYLPALKKNKRIAGKSKNDYFMGTDFTYDDMGGRKIDADRHTLLGEEVIEGERCYKVESVPLDTENMYSKKIAWVVPQKWVIKKVEFYDRQGKLLKLLTVENIQQVDGIWTPFVLHMRNLSTEHQTRIEIGSVQDNVPINDQVFTVASLERGRIQ